MAIYIPSGTCSIFNRNERGGRLGRRRVWPQDYIDSLIQLQESFSLVKELYTG